MVVRGRQGQRGGAVQAVRLIEAIQRAPDGADGGRWQQLRAKVEAGEVEGGMAANLLGSAERTRR